MDPADLINGGISLCIALFFLLVAVGVVPLGRNEKQREKLSQYRWVFWIGFFATAALGVMKLFGIAR